MRKGSRKGTSRAKQGVTGAARAHRDAPRANLQSEEAVTEAGRALVEELLNNPNSSLLMLRTESTNRQPSARDTVDRGIIDPTTALLTEEQQTLDRSLNVAYDGYAANVSSMMGGVESMGTLMLTTSFTAFATRLGQLKVAPNAPMGAYGRRRMEDAARELERKHGQGELESMDGGKSGGEEDMESGLEKKKTKKNRGRGEAKEYTGSGDAEPREEEEVMDQSELAAEGVDESMNASERGGDPIDENSIHGSEDNGDNEGLDRAEKAAEEAMEDNSTHGSETEGLVDQKGAEAIREESRDAVNEKGDTEAHLEREEQSIDCREKDSNHGLKKGEAGEEVIEQFAPVDDSNGEGEIRDEETPSVKAEEGVGEAMDQSKNGEGGEVTEDARSPLGDVISAIDDYGKGGHDGLKMDHQLAVQSNDIGTMDDEGEEMTGQPAARESSGEEAGDGDVRQEESMESDDREENHHEDTIESAKREEEKIAYGRWIDGEENLALESNDDEKEEDHSARDSNDGEKEGGEATLEEEKTVGAEDGVGEVEEPSMDASERRDEEEREEDGEVQSEVASYDSRDGVDEEMEGEDNDHSFYDSNDGRDDEEEDHSVLDSNDGREEGDEEEDQEGGGFPMEELPPFLMPYDELHQHDEQEIVLMEGEEEIQTAYFEEEVEVDDDEEYDGRRMRMAVREEEEEEEESSEGSVRAYHNQMSESEVSSEDRSPPRPFFRGNRGGRLSVPSVQRAATALPLAGPPAMDRRPQGTGQGGPATTGASANQQRLDR